MQISRIIQNSQAEFAFNQVSHLLISLIFILVLVGLFASQFENYLSKAKASEGLTLVTTIKQEVSAVYFETGNWPEASVSYQGDDYGSVTSITFDGKGGIHILFSNQAGTAAGKTLSLIAATPELTNSGNLLWICGHAKPPTSYLLNSSSKTDLPPSLAVSVCRNTKS